MPACPRCSTEEKAEGHAYIYKGHRASEPDVGDAEPNGGHAGHDAGHGSDYGGLTSHSINTGPLADVAAERTGDGLTVSATANLNTSWDTDVAHKRASNGLTLSASAYYFDCTGPQPGSTT